MRAAWRPPARTVAGAVALVVLAGCGMTSLDDRPLPFTRGNGDDALVVTVEMANAVNLVPNAEVKVDDVTVGSVRSIELVDWHARLTVGLDRGVDLPRNVQARIAQKSLLGAEYLELAAPTTEEPVGALEDGATIPLAQTGRYPETEELFAALSTVLNGGGLSQVATITSELDDALGGREGDVRALLGSLNRLVGTLDDQRDDIVVALEGLERLSGTFAADAPALEEALETLPDAVDVLRREREDLTRTLTEVAAFGDETGRLLDDNRTALRRNLESLEPVLHELGDAGTALTNFLAGATFPFPLEGLIKSAKGDYLNLFLTVDISTQAITRDLLGGLSPMDILYGGLIGSPPSSTATGDADPLDVEESIARIPDEAPEDPLGTGLTPAPDAPGGLEGLLRTLMGGGS